jgi:GNAT superfamily N-acetyltransferase
MDDLGQASVVMARAFRNDPLWRYMFPDPRRRDRYLGEFFTAMLAFSMGSKHVYAVGRPIEGVAIWSPPDRSNPGLSAMAAARFLKLSFSPFLLAAFKARRVLFPSIRMRRKYAFRPHYYLEAVGVLPEAQGRERASQLIRPFLSLADKRRTGVYTETMTPANVGLYEHYGFTCVEKHRISGTGLTIWAFYRGEGRANV